MARVWFVSLLFCSNVERGQRPGEEEIEMGGAGDVRLLGSVHMRGWRHAGPNRARPSHTMIQRVISVEKISKKDRKSGNRTCSSMSSSTRASTASSSSVRLRTAHGYGASVSARYVRQFSTNTGRSHAPPAPAPTPAAAPAPAAGAACRRRAASFSPAAATHIRTAGSTSASSARSIVARSSALPTSPSPSPFPSASASSVCSARIARRSCACARSACGGAREESA